MPSAQQAYPGYPPYQQQQPYQPGPWPGQPQYMPMPPAPKAPSPISDAKLFVEKLPLVAAIVFIGFAVVGLFNAILMFATTGTLSSLVGALGSLSYGTGPSLGGIIAGMVFSGIGTLVQYIVYGLIAFAILMVLKRFLDMKQAGIDAKAAEAS